MVAVCCICGVERIKNSKRTFHKFPRSDDLKQKWCKAIGREIKYKTAVVCSDHFRNDDFRNLCGTGVRPLLVPDAIPFVIHSNNSSDVNNVSFEPPDTNNSKVINNPSSTLIDVERKSDDATAQPQKRSRYQCARLGVMRREDFVSESAWEQFGSFLAFTKSNMKNIQRKNDRLRQKVNNLQTLINILKKRSFLAKNAAKILVVGSQNVLTHSRGNIYPLATDEVKLKRPNA